MNNSSSNDETMIIHDRSRKKKTTENIISNLNIQVTIHMLRFCIHISIHVHVKLSTLHGPHYNCLIWSFWSI